MKFRLGDIVKTYGLKGIVIAVFYHKVQVSFPGRRPGTWIIQKKDVELMERRGFIIKMMKTCVHCGKRFECCNKRRSRGRGLPDKVRGFKMITCSHKCSKEYHYNQAAKNAREYQRQKKNAKTNNSGN